MQTARRFSFAANERRVEKGGDFERGAEPTYVEGLAGSSADIRRQLFHETP
jgi:hypothetical protein